MDSGLKYFCVTALGLMLVACGDSTLDEAIKKENKNTITITSSGDDFNAVTGLMITLVARGGSGSYLWSVDDENNATISNNGELIGLKDSTVLVTAEDSEGHIGNATIVITDEEVLSISITPRSAAIVSGDAKTFTVTTAWSNQTSADITRQANWVTDDPANISFSDPNGTVISRPGFVGESVITVSFGDKTATSILTVEEPVITVSAVDDTTSVAIGTTLQMVASGYASGNYNWSVGGSTISSINNTGLLSVLQTATIADTITVTATDVEHPYFFGTTTLAIDSAVLQSIVMTPSVEPVVSTGNSIQYSVLGNYSDGTSADITKQVTWSSNKQDAVTFALGETAGTVTAQSGFPGMVSIEVGLDDIVESTLLNILETRFESNNTGLYGGSVSSIVLHPTNSNILYAGVTGRVYKSIDAGATWNMTDSSYIGTVHTLFIDFKTPSTVYVMTSAGLFKSIDSGKSWIDTTANVPSSNYNAVSMDPTDSAVLYVGTGGLVGVYKSTDAGETWKKQVVDLLPDGIHDRTVFSLFVDPAMPTTVYAGTNTSGIYKSIDGGASWAATKNKLGVTLVHTLILGPETPTTIYAGVNGGYMRSSDGGLTWTGLPTWPGGTRKFIFDPNVPSTFYVSSVCGQDSGSKCTQYKSIDAGASWTKLTVDPAVSLKVYTISVDPQGSGTLYFGSSQGISKSVDGGVNWTTQNVGLTSTAVTTLQFDPVIPNILYAGTKNNGVFRSVDKGLNWVSINGDLNSLDISLLGIDPSSPGTIYAVTKDGYKVSRSIDGGESWTRADSGLENVTQPIMDIAIDPTTPGTLYVATFKGVFKSIDSGANWLVKSTGITVGSRVYSLLIDSTTTPATIYAGGNAGVFKSVDGGESWLVGNTGLADYIVYSLNLDLVTPSTIYAGTRSGVFKSVNGGTSWVAINTGTKSGAVLSDAIGVSTSSPNILYRSSSSYPLAISTNYGNTWTYLNTGAFGGGGSSLAIDPLDPSVLYLGTSKLTTAGIQ
ncbi:MAG: hypothetical protein ACC707_11625 [Thiohalomonadales bacterium]